MEQALKALAESGCDLKLHGVISEAHHRHLDPRIEKAYQDCKASVNDTEHPIPKHLSHLYGEFIRSVHDVKNEAKYKKG